MRRGSTLALALGVLTLAQGCGGGGWTRIEARPNGPWPARQRAQIWRAGRVAEWHAIRVCRDSISGVPFIQPPSCDSCRLATALADVDSVRAGDPAAGPRETVFLVGLGLFIISMAWCVMGGCELVPYT